MSHRVKPWSPAPPMFVTFDVRTAEPTTVELDPDDVDVEHAWRAAHLARIDHSAESMRHDVGYPVLFNRESASTWRLFMHLIRLAWWKFRRRS